MTQGVDVSEWQGRVDWPAVAAGGVDFAVARAGYGLSHPDPFFQANWDGAAGAGILRGAYLWFRASQDPGAQAAYFAAAMGPLGPHDLAPWADFETVDGVNPRVALVQLGLFLQELEHRTGRVPAIYTGPAFWSGLPGAADRMWARYPLAVAHYTTGAPTVPKPWTTWSYWQHTSAGRVPGIPGRVDLDVSVTPLITAPPGTPKEHPFMHLNAPVVATVFTADEGGYWEVAADGGIFAFGNADGVIPPSPLPSQKLAAPIVSAVGTRDGRGLLLTGADGGLYALGTAPFHGSVPGLPG